MSQTITKIRPLHRNDYHNEYLPLLQQEFTIDSSQITFEQFARFVDDTKKQTFVLEQRTNRVPETNIQIIGSVTIIIEEKLIHNMGKVCHIEDVVIDKKSRGKGYGKKLVQYCVDLATTIGCYKCILNCSEENVKFYEKCGTGFHSKGVEMAAYL